LRRRRAIKQALHGQRRRFLTLKVIELENYHFHVFKNIFDVFSLTDKEFSIITSITILNMKVYVITLTLITII